MASNRFFQGVYKVLKEIAFKILTTPKDARIPQTHNDKSQEPVGGTIVVPSKSQEPVDGTIVVPSKSQESVDGTIVVPTSKSQEHVDVTIVVPTSKSQEYVDGAIVVPTSKSQHKESIYDRIQKEFPDQHPTLAEQILRKL